MKTIKTITPVACIAALAGLGLTIQQSHAVVVTFTGGTVTTLGAGTGTTDTSASFSDVDFYEQGGFHLDFLPNAGSSGFATHVGNYYGAGNDVIHSHWEGGGFGGVTAVEITKIGGDTFDLNYFILTSNTIVGGGAADGSERAFVKALDSTDTLIGAPVMLPSEDWGFPATPIYLGSDFDAATKVVFYVESPVACFGMDEFFIDEPAPPPPGRVPDSGATLAFLSLALGGIFCLKHKADARKRPAV